MGAQFHHGKVQALPPFALLSQALPRLSRHELESVVELLIDRLDVIDGDSDIEPNGDELDGSAAEDDYQPGSEGAFQCPGCPISDPPEDDTEDKCVAGDDGCGPIWIHGQIVWGSVDEVAAD